MKKVYTILFLFALTGFTGRFNQADPKTVSIVPKPVSVSVGSGSKKWSGNVVVVARSKDEKQVATILQELLQTKKLKASVKDKSSDKNKIVLSTVNDPALGKEGYKLSVNDNGAVIQANSGAGLFYGTQSLLQLFTGTETPFVEITDYPRFAYRGLHLDVGRHMFPPAFIKKYIDLLAHHKMNRFHWHLTEDQGWRIEIKKYPKLQEVAAYRKETVIGHAATRTRGEKKQYDGQRYGGYYTQEEVKDIVKYAADRHVTVIPEIELPGHAQAALAAYPNLGCTGGPYETATTWGVFNDVFCAGKEETFTFLQDVFNEVLPLFPSTYIHIGGDECPKTRWKECPHCQKRMETEKLKDTHELQSYFIQRMEKYLNSKGRQIIGWDEILEGGLAPNATVMSWRGEEGGIAAARQNHDVIMTPGNWCYFDHYQDTTKKEPLAIGGYTTVKEVYGYEPVPPQLNETEAKHVLGAQGNVWTEYMKTSNYVEYMVYPRASAMAEVVWSPKESRNYDDFVQRMKTHVKRLEEWGVNYAKHIEKEF
ncbi:family 20 glycosylhydrolase [Fulvivirgaceae bacterium PWU4]|uniref:beta-N-acetylhexosaminidase n=1 Tax=Chryseosolibacter histidini TaxID=2782349 RepID=A0AAP2GR57_9BACT|nr:beta-N-acetylhexosaminidase [Chryseosolibacter histidini]MBT1699670.1 family 20 glycosylhydrolase [Chryseosolibacter histidini]